jgi:hypothetical protein
MAKLSENATMGFRVGGSAVGLAGAVFMAKNWTWRIIYLGGGVALGFAIPAGYDRFVAT